MRVSRVQYVSLAWYLVFLDVCTIFYSIYTVLWVPTRSEAPCVRGIPVKLHNTYCTSTLVTAIDYSILVFNTHHAC